MVTRTPDSVLQKIKGIVREIVAEKSGGEFTFGPIMVMSHEDVWGEERVFIYVVYDGDPDRLDVGWTGGLVDRVLQQVPSDELPIVPFKSFIHTSEWDEFYSYNVAPWIPATS